MPSTLNALLEDKRINEVKAVTALKSDAIPFMLLPVRIETRFMEVDKAPQLTATEGVDQILDALLYIQVNLLDITTPDALQPYLTSSIQQLNRITAQIKSLDGIAAKEKNMLEQMTQSLNDSTNIVARRLGENFFTAFRSAVNILQTTIAGLITNPLKYLTGAKVFLEALQKCHTNLLMLTSRKTLPYQNIKNKKSLYTHIEKSLQSCADFYHDQKQLASGITYLTKNQLETIQALNKGIKESLPLITTNLGEIYADEGWKKFVTEKVNPLLTKIEEGINAFDNEILPQLKSVPQPPAMDILDLLYHGMIALISVKKFNAEPAQQYNDLKKFKANISGKIDFINKSFEQQLNVNSRQEKQLTQLYSHLSTSLEQVKPTVGVYPAKNKSQQFGKDVLGKYLDTTAKETIEKAVNQLPGGGTVPKVHELWLRIYPDDIFIHTHEEALTVSELEAGKTFWNAWWVASNDEELEKASWKKLCGPLGTKRASWVANVLNPSKLVTPKNTQSLQNKPFAKVTQAQALAKNVAIGLQATKPAENPVKYFEGVVLGQLTAITTSIQAMLTQLGGVTTASSFLLQKLQVQLLRAQGDIQSIHSKADRLTAEQKVSFAQKITAFTSVETNFNALSEQMNSIEPLTVDEFLNKNPAPFDFPQIATKTEVWTVAPHTYVLPERFVAITMQSGRFVHVVVSNKVNKQLQMGPNPEMFSKRDEEGELAYKLDENGDLIIEEGLRWIADYQEAIKQGMAITIPLSREQYDTGFDTVLVVGVKETDSQNTASLIEKLFTNHVYAPDGMSLLKVGTPTNNTQDKSAGYSRTDNDEDERFEIEVKNKLFPEGETNVLKLTDGKRLADGLGIAPSVMQKVNNKMATQVSNAYVMNRALWHATIGHTMEEMWDHVFTYDNIRHTEQFFTSYCVGRGVLPTVRIGMQPYGFLPTTAYSLFKPHKEYDAYNMPPITMQDLQNEPVNRIILEQKKQVRFNVRLQEVLRILNKYWTDLRKSKVVHYENLSNGNPQKNFVEMLGLHATSLEYFYRYGVNIVRKGVNTNGPDDTYNIRNNQGAKFIFDLFKDLMIHGRYTPSFDFPDEKPVTTFPELFKLQDAKYNRMVTQFESSRIFRNRFLKLDKELKQLTGFMVDSQPLSDENLLEQTTTGSYIDWLLNEFMDTILAGNNPKDFPSRSLLFLLLRQSLMQAYQEGALNILQQEWLISMDLRRITGDEDTYDSWNYLSRKHHYNTKWHLLLKDIDELYSNVFTSFKPGNAFYDYLVAKTGAPDGRSSMATYIHKYETNSIFNGYPKHDQHRNLLTKVKEVREAFTALKSIPTAELSMLLAEHLDLCSYRLDAWMSGMVNKRLFEQRAKQPEGIHLGAYGWVENLRRDNNKHLADVATIPEGLKPADNEPIYQDPDNEGFIHAPSINHAVTAAVLRSAYKANYSEEDINNRLSVNISSARVRMALNLIDGIKNGLPVGAVLGFQFERGLHERYQLAELDQFILPFRNAFPLVLPVKENGQAGKEPAYNSNVVNGTSMLNKIFETVQWMDFPAQQTLFHLLITNKNNPSLKWLTDIVSGDKEYEQVCREIDRMADAFDALGDMVVSESVYQIVQGNHVRAAAVVSSLAQGKNIPDPQITETLRTGTIVTQRVLMNLDVQNSFTAPAGWPATPTPRALAEPSLNNWLGSIIGNPGLIKCIISYKEDTTEKTDIVSLSDLKIQPIDYLFVTAGKTDVKLAVDYQYRQSHLTIPASSQLTVDIASRQEDWNETIRSFSETMLLMQQIRDLLQQAKPAGADSFLAATAKPDENNPAGYDLLQLENRIKHTLQQLDNSIAALTADAFIKELVEKTKVLGAEGQPTTLTTPQLTALRNFLTSSSLFGIANSVPRIVFESSNDLEGASKDLMQQTLYVYAKLLENRKAADNHLKKVDSKTTGKQKAAIYSDVFKALFGKLFITLPLFNSINQPDLSAQLSLSAADSLLRHNSLMVMQDWWQSIASVRKSMKALQFIDMNAIAMNANPFTLHPVQFPYHSGDYWLGAEYPETYIPGEDKLSLVLLYPHKWKDAANSVKAGIVIDEWMEIIPNPIETTGITFNYNQPNAMTPQTVLLAVTPVEKGQWNWEDLVYTLLDTLEMAKNRAVEPDHLDKSPLSHILPAVLSEVAPPQSGDLGDQNVLGVQVVMDFAFNEEPKVVTP